MSEIDVDRHEPGGTHPPRRKAVLGRRKAAVIEDDGGSSRADILRVATEEFARSGFSGARVDAIAEKTRTSKRMIYYHFASKEGLYLAVLEQAYADIRASEADGSLTRLHPIDAMRRLVEMTFDYDEAHPDFVRLVSIENIHHARHLKSSPALSAVNTPVIETLAEVLDAGYRAGVFRGGVDPIDVHMLISSFCFFRISNQHTFGAIFGRDLLAPGTRARHRALIAEAVLRFLAPDHQGPASRPENQTPKPKGATP